MSERPPLLDRAITYNFEYDRKVRAGFIGCGDHAYRNIFPTFQYAPIDLIAVCDLQAERAAAFARQFGARRSYTDHREMLAHEQLDAVFIVAGYDEHHRPRYPQLAMEAMQAGVHVWIEKPPAASLAEVEAMHTVSQATGRFVSVGYKKMFFPAIAKAREISQRPEFGQPNLAGDPVSPGTPVTGGPLGRPRHAGLPHLDPLLPPGLDCADDHGTGDNRQLSAGTPHRRQREHNDLCQRRGGHDASGWQPLVVGTVRAVGDRR